LWRLPSSAWSVDFATSKRRHCRLAPLLGQQGNLDRTYKPTAHLAARLGVSHMT
jgi:hypothetical protein